MPTLADLQSRFATPGSLPEIRQDEFEEALVCDSRAGMSPAQFVEQKLRHALQSKGTFASPQILRRQKPR